MKGFLHLRRASTARTSAVLPYIIFTQYRENVKSFSCAKRDFYLDLFGKSDIGRSKIQRISFLGNLCLCVSLHFMKSHFWDFIGERSGFYRGLIQKGFPQLARQRISFRPSGEGNLSRELVFRERVFVLTTKRK